MLSAMMATLAEYFDSPIVLQTTSQGTTLVFQVSSAVTWLLRILIPIIVTALYLKIIPPTASSRCSSRASPVVRGVDPRGNISRGRGGQRSAHERTVQDQRPCGGRVHEEDVLRSAEAKGTESSPQVAAVTHACHIPQKGQEVDEVKSLKSPTEGVADTAHRLPPGFGSVKEVGQAEGVSLKNEDARKALETAIESFPSQASTVCQEVLQSLTLQGVIIEPQTYEAMIRAAEVSGDTELAGVLFSGVSVMAGDDRKGSLDEKASLAGRDAPAPAESPPGLSTAAASTANPATPLTIVPQEEAKHPEPMRLNAKAPEFIPSTGGHGTAPTTRFLDSLMDHRRAVAAARYYQNQVMTARYMGGLAAMAKAQMQAVQLAQAQGAQLSQYHPNAPSMPTMKEDKLLEWSAARAEEQAQVQMRVKRILDENNSDAKEDPSKKGSTPDEKQPQLRVDVDDLKKASPERKRELLGLYTSGERFLYNAFFLVDFEGSPTSAMRQAAGAFGVDE
ncbi:hypothetical protein Pmar_PMAR029306 [Perkinsus marinus ATCC 50983]|uniref:Uncharacterized protein n=1 Tax=Perkinsus marinus (strain ATCC 50983 / TXsc) TaxID=423536 RepID=C5KMT2_PERM5|nr:hypothetical protein Pmar_PMAR029306 [Perkinsus marinus ATCC 50983]EER14240.1 hypothetical protein Pmar_PMAR029306 [Perkinsus marinus ATCC 50983]|eukprot:XP_002782445.1 hypothetical protein Pmar_PMAR029306 [Perkinsus marinus ATCC 50983]